MTDLTVPAKMNVCPKCGSEKIRILAWIDGNTRDIVDETEGDDSVWCVACEKHSDSYDVAELRPGAAAGSACEVPQGHRRIVDASDRRAHVRVGSIVGVLDSPGRPLVRALVIGSELHGWFHVHAIGASRSATIPAHRIFSIEE